jgi:hypothetical protein
MAETSAGKEDWEEETGEFNKYYPASCPLVFPQINNKFMH